MDGVKKILVIDDEEDLREIYSSVLQRLGFSVATAVNGREGLEKAAEGGYALILLDMMMPVLDGLGFMNQYETSEAKQKNGPVVVLTNLSRDQVVSQMMTLGAAGFVNKIELNPEQFASRVEEFVNQKGTKLPD